MKRRKLDIVKSKEYIRKLIKRKGYSVQGFQRAIGISETTLYNRKNYISIDLLILLSDVLGVTIDELVFPPQE